MADQLSLLVEQFSLHAGIFYAGNICGTHRFAGDALRGHLHLVRRGPVKLVGQRKATIRVQEPTLVFLPRPAAHRLIADDTQGADVICGTIEFGGGTRGPIPDSLPDVVQVRLADMPELASLLQLLFDEAFAQTEGRQAILDRLAEVLIIRLLRYCIEQGLTRGGTLAGLTDTRLAKAVEAMHREPQRDWGLESLARVAGMSRARFAASFRSRTGLTPLAYLTRWRLSLAQRLLIRGRPLQLIAQQVGYGSSSALSRVFSRELGVAPTQWLQQQRAGEGGEVETEGALHEIAG